MTVLQQGTNLYGYFFFFHPGKKVMEGQSWVVRNLVGLVWWEIKMYQQVRTFIFEK